MRFVDDFERREWLGREALKELKKLYPEYFKYELNFMDDKYGTYDAYWFIINENQQIVKRVWIEIKIRDFVYDEYILEKKKLKQLIKKREELYLKEEDVVFLYLNYTPKETIIWNITNMDPNNTEKLKANKATCDSRNDKVNKDVIMLKKEQGRVLKYVLDEKMLLLKWEQNYLIEKVKKEIKKRPGLEDILFGM